MFPGVDYLAVAAATVLGGDCICNCPKADLAPVVCAIEAVQAGHRDTQCADPDLRPLVSAIEGAGNY